MHGHCARRLINDWLAKHLVISKLEPGREDREATLTSSHGLKGYCVCGRSFSVKQTSLLTCLVLIAGTAGDLPGSIAGAG